MRYLVLSLLFVIFSTSSCLCESQIEIKGIKIGMSKIDYENIVGVPSRFTIAGVYSKNMQPISSQFQNNKLEGVSFYFNSKEFDSILNAVRLKFPDIICTNREIKNKFGAVFTDIGCKIATEVSTLTLTKYLDVNTSVLSLVSQELVKKHQDKQKEKAKDI